MASKLKPLAEQVIVVTGASSGIGLVTAKLAAARGARVLLVARGEAALKAAVDEIRAAGGTADLAVADVGSRDQVDAAADRAISSFGRIDGWVNNAGVAIYARLVDTPDDEHERLFRTNYFGVVHGSLTAIPHLRAAGGGAIVNLGSLGSQVPSVILSAYTATKFAVRAFTLALRVELEDAGEPIGVTLVMPSGITTPLAEQAMVHAEGDARVPTPSYDPEVVARAILDALEHDRREVTVGGLGRATVLLSTHFPRLNDWIGGITRRALLETDDAPEPRNNLFEPLNDGRERSRIQTGRRTSLYTAAVRHPWATRAVTIATAAGIATILARRARDRKG